MKGTKGHGLFLLKRDREFTFIPRIINPVQVEQVVFFSANESVRKALRSLRDKMPWVKTKLFSDPLSVTHYDAGGPTVLILDDTALTLVDEQKIRRTNENIIIVLLSSIELIQCSPPALAQRRFPYTNKADLVFAVNREDITPEVIIDSVIKCAEDRLNILKYSKAKRYIFLIIDDEPRWFSQFLPVLYNIIGQRVDVMVTRTYEETLQFLFGVSDESAIDKDDYLLFGKGDEVICVITDIYFPKGDDVDATAGKELIGLIKKYYPRIPVIIASKADISENLKKLAFTMPKGDPGSLETLRHFIHDYSGIGDFILVNEEKGIQYRIKDIFSLYEILEKAEGTTDDAVALRETLEYYGERDYFSTWLYMHGLLPHSVMTSCWKLQSAIWS